MKLKITNLWIPISLIVLFITGVLLISIEYSETLIAIGAITAVSALLISSFVYFPILIIAIFRGKIENKNKIVNNAGIFSLTLIVLGALLRLMGIPGAGPFIVGSSAVFYLNFLPVWYAAQYKETDRFGRVFYFIACTCLGIYILAHQFKVMHWPWADQMTKISIYTALIALLPICLFLLIKRNFKYFNISSPFLFGFILAYILGGYISANMTKKIFANNNTTFTAFEKNTVLYQNKCKYLYDALNNSKLEDTTFLAYKNRTITLKQSADSLYNYIQNLKAQLIKETDGLTVLHPDSIKYELINNKTNYDIPTFILIGNDLDNPQKGPNTAFELKQKITSYIDKTNSLLPEEAKVEYKLSLPFDFSSVEEDGMTTSWEVYSFYHVSLSSIYSTLTNMQSNVRYMEMTALTELFNKANTSNKANIAAQMAELAMKYESTKKEKEISILQKDKELNDVKMQAKDAEISSREGTITLFIFGAIVFGILMIFVIRSNILRKQTNKELAAQKDIITAQKNEVEGQKHLIEEKQKEIVDSITYAKRLQEAILPAQEIVNKHLSENFILYTPKDLVAGDFYWMEVVNDGDKEITFIAAADSTGHGVPGAMVSVVCSNALNRAVLEFKLTTTGQILDKTRELVLETFSKSTTDVKDGMDISLLAVIRKNNEIVAINWSGANNPLWYASTLREPQGSAHQFSDKKNIENEMVAEALEATMYEIKANKQPIGKTDNPTPFTTHSIPYVKGTSFYLFTDGYADQFGGPKGKKFKYKQLEDLLLEISTKEMSVQKETLNSKFEDWKSGIEQVDDVCVIGVKL